MLSDTPDSSVTNFPATSEETSTSATEVTVKDPVEINSDSEFELDFEALSEESATTTFKPKRDLSDMYVKDATTRKAPRQAKWFPMLLAPTALDGSLAGDVGFDPLGFSKDKESLKWMREAEIKHSRLAMLGAAGWPLSELWHKGIADTLGLDSILAEADKAPSVLNGGMSNTWIIATGAISLLIGGLLELRTKEMSEKAGYVPGDLNFDPLGLHSFRSTFGLDQITENLSTEQKLANAKFDMELCEIKHGRLAMIAMTGFVAQEFVTGIPVVQQTPFFFGDPIV